MGSIDRIKASDGSGNAAVATVQSSRSPGSSTIIVDGVAGIPDTFMGSMGTPHTFTDPITSEVITVISEATCVDFSGHVDGANLEIDDIAPGQTDLGSEISDIIIIRPTTQWGDNVAEVLEVSHEDDGALKEEAILGAIDVGRGVLGTTQNYIASTTWTKPDDLKFIVVEVMGGGGGGGGVGTSAGSGAGAGGGQGELSRSVIAAASLAATVAVTVGGGGAGGSGNATGTTGTTSSFGAHVTAIGGSGGAGSSGVTKFRPGGVGGTGGTANFAVRGAPGQSGGGDASSIISGAGGGPGGGVAISGDGTGSAGVRGGGGSGALDTGTTSRVGGAGGAGYVIVREYF